MFLNEKRFPENPWITSDAVKILSSCLKPTDVGVEYGSGRSTKWFASRLHSLCSIENDKLWFEKVKKDLINSGYNSKVDYRLCENDIEYARQAETFHDNTIDFCLIDGAVRDQCAKNMLNKIKPGGLMVIDNANWYLPNNNTISPNSRRNIDAFPNEIWEEVWGTLSRWRMIWTSNGVIDTAIWIKTQ